MNIIKKTQKFSYIEKKSKDNKNLIESKLSVPAEELKYHERITMGQNVIHETNKHISNNFKKNYNEINWDNKINYNKKIENKLKNKYKYTY
jgi:uncharacterized protein with HEPN domain